jgi:NADPH-dependent 2,4-dienoyl-CoA reductase/sulfur reductase-like enzyme
VFDRAVHTVRGSVAEAHGLDALILATGATDRLLPVAGWTLPGVYSLGGAQTLLKDQGCAIGRAVVFCGSSPLLYLAALQYSLAGAHVVAILDTTPLAAKPWRPLGWHQFPAPCCGDCGRWPPCAGAA